MTVELTYILHVLNKTKLVTQLRVQKLTSLNTSGIFRMLLQCFWHGLYYYFQNLGPGIQINQCIFIQVYL